MLVFDLVTFVVAVSVGEYAGHAVLPRRAGAGVRATAALALVAATVAFATLSFRPPACFLFDEPQRGAHGGP